MRELHVFTEELSMKKVLEIILPKILPENMHFRIYHHQGKQDLEKALRKALPSVSRRPGAKVLITRDQDSGDCHVVKSNFVELAQTHCSCDFFVRIVCRELESWFIGDFSALEKAYPRFSASSIKNKAKYRDVDQLVNPAMEILRIIPEYQRKKNLPKLEVSEKVAIYLNPDENRSQSFKNTVKAIRILAGVN